MRGSRIPRRTRCLRGSPRAEPARETGRGCSESWARRFRLRHVEGGCGDRASAAPLRAALDAPPGAARNRRAPRRPLPTGRAPPPACTKKDRALAARVRTPAKVETCFPRPLSRMLARASREALDATSSAAEIADDACSGAAIFFRFPDRFPTRRRTRNTSLLATPQGGCRFSPATAAIWPPRPYGLP